MMRATLALLALAACTDGGVPPLDMGLPDAAYWPPRPSTPGSGDWLLVTNNLDDTVSIIDYASASAGSLVELARVPVGFNPVEREGPHHCAAAPDGEHYYVGLSNYVPGSGSGPHGLHGGGTSDGQVVKIRALDHGSAGAARVDPSPGDVRLTPDGATLLVSHFDLVRVNRAVSEGLPLETMDATLALIDVATMRVRASITLCPAAHGIAVAPDGSEAYVTCLSDELAVVDLVAPEHPVTRLRVGPGSAAEPFCYPYALAVSPDGADVWVSCFISGELVRYDTATRTIDEGGRVTLPGPAVFGAFSADGSRLYVPHQILDGVAVVDPAAGRIVADYVMNSEDCVSPHVLRLSGDESRIFLVCEGHHSIAGSIVVMESATGVVQDSLPLGRFPDDLQLLRRSP